MANEALLNERLSLVREAVAMKSRPARIPQNSFYVTWKIFDSGYKLHEAMMNYDIMEKIVREHQEVYGWDTQFEPGTRNAFRVTMPMGGGWYTIDDENDVVAFRDQAILEPEEFDEFMADQQKFFWNKSMARKYPQSWNKNTTLEQMQQVWDEFQGFMQYAGHIGKVLKEEYGLPPLQAPYGAYPAPDFMFNTIRGIKGFCVDLRKNLSKTLEVFASLDAVNYEPGMRMFESLPDGPVEGFCFDFGITGFCHNFINMKQWDSIYWPYIKRMLDAVAKQHKNCCMFMEGESKRFWDYFKDYPKGTICMRPDKEDCFELRRECPDIAIMGGMPNVLLGTGTVQECLDLAKKCCDELGRDGGFIMSQDKLGSFRIDGKRENLKAVCDFVRDYR